jgi:hypothetical protein
MPARLTRILLLTLALAGCGDTTEKPSAPPKDVPPSAQAAQTVDPAAFPPAGGRTLEEIAGEFDTQGPQAALATSVFRTGPSRIAFGVLDEELHFVYGKTVVYVEAEGEKAQGPIAAPADVLLTEKRYRSQTAATESDPFAAVYEASVDLERTGYHRALVVSEVEAGKRVAALVDFEVKSPRADRIPDVGEPAPKVKTDTADSVKGDEDLLDTRVPPAPQLHEAVFADVVGKKPVALLFATPALCQSRVCGPVVDEALQLQARYGDRITFIHQEVYEGNEVAKGLREPLKRYGLQTEPWLFTVKADGTIAARLEGSFGLRAFEDALEAAL